MPRAAEQATRIREHLDVVRESMKKLNDELKQVSSMYAIVSAAPTKYSMRQQMRVVRPLPPKLQSDWRRSGYGKHRLVFVSFGSE